MALTNINSYPVPHNKNGNGGGGVTYIMKGGNGSSNFDTLNVNTINAIQGNITYLDTHSLTANDADIAYIMSSDGRITRLEGDELNYKEGYIGTLASDYISTKKLKADEIDALAAWIETLNSKEITTEYLTVTKQAHFFELIIDKLRSVEGQIILTAANCVVDFVKGYNKNGDLVCISGPDVMLYLFDTVNDPDNEIGSYGGLITTNGEVKKLDNWEYRDATEQETNTFKSWFVYDANDLNTIKYFDVYWRAIDEQGMAIDNGFIASDGTNGHRHDQVICQSFNVHEGTSYNVSNKYYWRIVNSVYDDVWLNLTGGAEQATSAGTSMIDYSIALWNTQSLLYDEEQEQDVLTDNNITWMGRAQQAHGLVAWTEGTDPDASLYGTMSTDTTAYGIELVPYTLEDNVKRAMTREEIMKLPVTNKVRITVKQISGMQNGPKYAENGFNIGIYFTDDTFIFYKDPEIDWTLQEPAYVFDLADAQMPIEAIVIVSTTQNEWKKCHKMRLSNISNECDAMLDALAGAPSKGDNIAQLGYRTDVQDDPDIARQSAIIISAYKSVDSTLEAPSYAHYFGINDFDLVSHRHSYFDAKGARFEGDITLANVDGLPITDRFIKLAVTSEPIVATYAENGTRTLAPANIALQIIETESTTATVPTGYTVFYKFTDKNGNSSATTSISAGASINSIPLLNTWVSSNTTYIADKFTAWIVKGNVYNQDIIDTISVGYDEKDYWKTDSWQIAPVKEIAYAGILDAYANAADGSNSQNCNLELDLDYMVVHYKQGVVENPAFNSPNGLHIVIQAYAQATNGTITALGNGLTMNYNTAKHAKYTDTNYLATLYPNTPTKQDYLKNYKSHRADNPLYFTVKLLDGNEELDSRTLYVSLQSGAILKVSDNAIVSAVAASKSYTDARETAITEAYTSMIEQTAQHIMSDVSSTYVSNNDFNTTVESLNSNIEQQAGFIRSAVRRQYINTDFYLDSDNAYSKMLDLTGLDVSKYYRVRMTLDQSFTTKTSITIQIERQLQAQSAGWGVPSWGIDNDDHSITGVDLMFNCTFITTGAGAISGGNLYVNEYWLMYANGNVIGDIGSPSDNTYLYAWLRGGSKYQLWCTNEAIKTSAVVQNTNYKNSVEEPTIYKATFSEIEQTAERISLSVFEEVESGLEDELKRTGIDIEAGTITLDSENTVFTGNIIMSNPNEGLIIKDSNGNARINILNNSLGNLSSFDFGIDNLLTKLEFQTYSSTSSTVTHTFAAQTLGTLSAGQQLKLKNMEIVGYWTDYDFTTQSITSATYSYVLKCGSSTITTQSGTATASQYSNLRFTLPDYNNSSVPNSGTYTITLTVTFNLSSSQVNKGTFKFFNQIGVYSVSPSINRIGLDGAVFASGPEKYNWFGSDYTQIRNGRSILRLKDNVIERNCYQTNGTYTETSFGDISSTMPYAIIDGLSYTATADDCIIFFKDAGTDNTSARSLMLPQPGACPGKVYFIKNAVYYTSPLSGNYISTDCNVTTVGSNGLIWHSDGHKETTINIKGESAIFISCGMWWISFNCD